MKTFFCFVVLFVAAVVSLLWEVIAGALMFSGAFLCVSGVRALSVLSNLAERFRRA